MDDQFGEFAKNDEPIRNADFKPARFYAELGLPAADDCLLKAASAAVRKEYRDCSKWKRLRCRKVSIFAERDRGTVYVVHVGGSVEFDWTWEGAVAFKPKSLDGDRSYSDSFYESAAYEDEILWKGEVLEVDERNGCLFISLDNPEAPPTTGSFFVRPFEFLSVLDAVYNDSAFEIVREDFPGRLAATEGGIHPAIANASRSGLPRMTDWWQHSWCVLWGPPGTGKTYTTGQQIAAALSDPRERILVVSTTNRATDAVALAIGKAANSRKLADLPDGHLLRIGKGASLPAFTTIFIDEAGLISRAAVAALTLLAARRVVLVGDSKQLAPISRISRILPTRQQTWLANSGLSHLDDLKDTPAAVFVLDEQRRMHPVVCRVVSEFQYGGFLKTASDTSERSSNLPPFLSEYARAIWYVLDGSQSARLRSRHCCFRYGQRQQLQLAVRRMETTGQRCAEPGSRSSDCAGQPQRNGRAVSQTTACCLNQVGYPNGSFKKNAVIGLKSVAIQTINSGSLIFGGQDIWFEVVPDTNCLCPKPSSGPMLFSPAPDPTLSHLFAVAVTTPLYQTSFLSTQLPCLSTR